MTQSTSESASISRQDVVQSLNLYTELMKSSGKYYRKILEVSQAGSEFAAMLEAMGKSKGAEQSGTGLKAAAELHRTIAKNQEQLAEAVHKDFELPLQRNFTAHQKRVDDNEKTYEKNVRKIQDEISKTETKMLKGRKKDMTAFQQSLQDMQKLAQELEKQRLENMETVLSDEQKNFMFLVQKAAGVVKSQYEHFSNLAVLSRDITEEIISIAFSPPGKVLDAHEKKRLVDKFLGAPTHLSTGGSAVSAVGAHRPSFAGTLSSVEDQMRRGSIDTGAPIQRPPMPPTHGHSLSGGMVTPSISPVNASETASLSSSLKRTSASNATIQESLQKLNLAAQTAKTGADHSKLAADLSLDLVIAVHDFTARTDRELSFAKNDVMLVKQRQENWLYATHYAQQQTSPTSTKSGWIPVSYTTVFKQQQ